ncbi:formin [Angomonas deanei]|uniref:Formin Homology 2 Domain, putative n=1 Tax=Angomonas deanei TaxID=59799 RepID=A0A7G2CRP7_9TRYP|nr:formin [Angomonas deanei]CAD2221671.1 Formin Homology 2 Domain, putative [Angomonas deanei]|eukprot:EPY19048.1 formin [Angomonas deanei]
MQKVLLQRFPRSIPKKEEEVKKKEVAQQQILDENRERNVGIVLNFLRLPIQQIQASVLSFDELTLGEEYVSALAKILPTANDIDSIKRAEKRTPDKKWSVKDIQELSLPVRFFLMTLNIPQFNRRISAWNLKYEFDTRVNDFRSKLEVVYEAVECVLTATKLPVILSYVLAIVNFLNEGTRCENAKGFPISQLAAIINLRYTEGKGTLLDYLVEMIREKNPSLRDFPSEFLDAVDKARDVDVGSINQELKALRSRLQDSVKLVRMLADDKRWSGVMGRFIYKALPSLEETEHFSKTLNVKIDKLYVFMCEEKSKTSLSEIFRMLSVFAKRFTQEHERQVERQERLDRMTEKGEVKKDVPKTRNIKTNAANVKPLSDVMSEDSRNSKNSTSTKNSAKPTTTAVAPKTLAHPAGRGLSAEKRPASASGKKTASPKVVSSTQLPVTVRRTSTSNPVSPSSAKGSRRPSGNPTTTTTNKAASPTASKPVSRGGSAISPGGKKSPSKIAASTMKPVSPRKSSLPSANKPSS